MQRVGSSVHCVAPCASAAMLSLCVPMQLFITYMLCYDLSGLYRAYALRACQGGGR